MTTLSKCCVSGHLHQGEPKGTVAKFAGLDTYITGTNASRTIMVITDIFGTQLPNVKLLADEYAQAGDLRVIVPDFFLGDAVPLHHMRSLTPLHSQPTPTDEGKQAAFSDVGPWLGRHGDDKVDELFKQVLTRLKNDKDVVHIGVLGFCWGGRHALRLGGMNLDITAVVANHPSFTEFPATFVDLRVPTLVQKGTDDAMFPDEQAQEVQDKIFPSKKNSRIVIFPGAVHGFGIRGDLNNDEERKLKEESVKNAVDFFHEFFV